MKNNCRKKAFTLVELLVVVLIIGILAAIALPQYQKAVERAKATEALVVLKAVIQGAEAYHLANGTWPRKFDELAVDIPWTGNQKGTTDGNVKDVRSNKNWALEMYIPPASFSMHRVYVTRINNNRYKGVVIMYAFQNQEEDIEKIAICVERSGTFPGNTGDYCSKILHAQKIGNTARYKLTF